MSSPNDVRLQVLHTVRILGYAGTSRVSKRAGLPAVQVDQALLDAQAAGQVIWTRFEDDGGWSLTEAGKALGERLLAEELERADARGEVESVMTGFEPLNRQVTTACTNWQLAEMGIAEPSKNLADTVKELARAAEAWALLEEHLVRRLPRFDGYHERFSVAVEHARTDPVWVAATDRESAHRVWFELHEDLLATLGRSR
ncbi:hypothetical protein D477_020113 [Arthrobacter crystallopoietes BAB-32]|uniref:Uncharacterized protein n=1 Tax=Arthrobacter crystallopoietes BAB-32 TaxID=1246476 RepID=N1UXF9_9MICC|nr:hypothetical protein [Arthrobacter crystallopoietes]EMY32449.1 hypothetical protein D477_020113 [Arthrobacter crystallopoietes BAB-32]